MIVFIKDEYDMKRITCVQFNKNVIKKTWIYYVELQVHHSRWHGRGLYVCGRELDIM